MKNVSLKRGSLFAGAILASMFFVSSCNTEEEKSATPVMDDQKNLVGFEESQAIPGQYILMYKDGQFKGEEGLRKEAGYNARQAFVKESASASLKKYGVSAANLLHVYSAKSNLGMAAKLSDAEVAKIKESGEFEVYQDEMIALRPWWCVFFPSHPDCNGGGGGGNDPAQETPWGITRVGGAVDFSNSPKKAWVIDTGIDLDHNDLNVNTSLSRSFVGGSANDGNGHGTHVAGTIAAINNTIGVVGVAAGAEVVAVKVLGDNGSGSNAGVIAGVDYVAQTAKAGDVANMSLGGGANTATDNAVRNLAAAGVLVSLAAGNDSRSATGTSPARTNGPNIYTISSMTSADRLSGFSNFGNPPVDFAAPGSSIKSTWANGGYRTISGTSMAAPHAAGVLLVTGGNPKSDGTISGDKDSTPDKIIQR